MPINPINEKAPISTFELIKDESNSPTLKIFRTDPTVGDTVKIFEHSFDFDAPNALGLNFDDGLGLLSLFSLLEPPTGKWLFGAPTLSATFSDRSPIYQDDPATVFYEPQTFYAFPTEAQLFTRDPEDFASSLEQLPFVQYAQFGVNQLDEGALSILSPGKEPVPPSNDHNVTCGPFGSGKPCPKPEDTVPTTVAPIWPEYVFPWLSESHSYFEPTLGGPAGRPTGHGSIKAIRVHRPGWCTNEQFFEDIFHGGSSTTFNFEGTVRDAIKTRLCDKVDQFLLHYLTAIPLLRHTPGKPQDAHGQLFVSMELYAQIGGFGCTVAASMILDMTINSHGVLGFQVAHRSNGEPLQRFEAVKGNGCGPIPYLSSVHTIFPPGSASKPSFHTLSIESILKWATLELLPGILSLNTLEAQSFPPQAFVGDVDTKFPEWVAQPGSGSQECPDDTTFLFQGRCKARGCSVNPFNLSNGTTRSQMLGDRYVAQGDICFEARQDLCSLIRRGFMAQGRHPAAPSGFGSFMNSEFFTSPVEFGPGCQRFANPNADEQLLYSLFDAVERRVWNDERELAYWNCVQAEPDVDKDTGGFKNLEEGHCYFTPPIHRLIMNPDSLQAVFFEKPAVGERQEFNNASLAFWYALKGYEASSYPGNDANLSGLMCNYTRGPSAFTRPYPLLNLSKIPCPLRVGLCRLPAGCNGMWWEDEIFVPECVADKCFGKKTIKSSYGSYTYTDFNNVVDCSDSSVSDPTIHPCMIQ